MDGDNIRHGLNNNLGFSAEDRQENIRRIGEVAKLFADMGVITLVSFISPYRADRDSVRARMDRPTDFVEVFMKIPIEVCEERDPKGLYKAARAGKIKVRARPPREPPPTPARRPVVALAATGRLEKCAACTPTADYGAADTRTHTRTSELYGDRRPIRGAAERRDRRHRQGGGCGRAREARDDGEADPRPSGVQGLPPGVTTPYARWRCVQCSTCVVARLRMKVCVWGEGGREGGEARGGADSPSFGHPPLLERAHGSAHARSPWPSGARCANLWPT